MSSVFRVPGAGAGAGVGTEEQGLGKGGTGARSTVLHLPATTTVPKKPAPVFTEAGQKRLSHVPGGGCLSSADAESAGGTLQAVLQPELFAFLPAAERSVAYLDQRFAGDGESVRPVGQGPQLTECFRRVFTGPPPGSPQRALGEREPFGDGPVLRPAGGIAYGPHAAGNRSLRDRHGPW